MEDDEGGYEAPEADNNGEGGKKGEDEDDSFCAFDAEYAFRFQIVHLTCYDQAGKQLQKLHDQVTPVPELVPLAHTNTNPRTVVIVHRDTLVAVLTMFAAQWLLHMTNSAVFLVHE